MTEGTMTTRLAARADLSAVADIHQEAFPAFFMTMLGRGFLMNYYAQVLDDPGGILVILEQAGRPVGFVAGFLDPMAFYAELRKRRLGYLLKSLPSLCLRPWLLPRLCASYAYARGAQWAATDSYCELASIGVGLTAQGQGAGRMLLTAFLDQVRNTATQVRLTTDALGNDRVNTFYQAAGFRVIAQFEKSKGRFMNVYQLDLQP